MPLKHFILYKCSGLTSASLGLLQSFPHLQILYLPNDSPMWLAAAEELRKNEELTVRLDFEE